MDFENTLHDELNIEINDLSDYSEDFEYVNDFLIRNNINIAEFLKVQFVNHIYMLIKRLKENELSNLEQCDFGEIDKDSYRKAEEVLKPLFKKYKREENKTEIILISIYFESSKGEK